MYIRSIHFRDWKAYVDATFEFPPPRKGKNVVVINAKNGYGKTSLLEGIVLGLYGKDGLALIGRAVLSGADDQKSELSYSYNEFLERAFHAQACAQGRSSASITLIFESEEGERVKLLRRWHFSGNGRHRPEQEEALIYLGADEDLVSIPKLQDRDDFVRSFVARHFLPVSLAQFFLFDGEQVQRLAKKDMAAQVKHGIEGILGVPVLRELRDDLRSYAKDRRKLVGNVGDERIDRLRDELRQLESREEEISGELEAVVPRLVPLKDRREQLVREMSSVHGGSYASLKELYESREDFVRKRDLHKDELRRLLLGDLALALTGAGLRRATRTQLAGETVRSRWELGKTQGDTGFERFVSSLEETPPPIEPPLTKSQKEKLEERLRNAWQNLWYPPPENCASEYRHEYLTDGMRTLVVDRLDRIEDLAISHIGDLLEKIEELDGEVRRIDGRVAQQGGVEQEVERIKNTLQEVMGQLSQLEGRERDLQRDLEGLRGQLNPKRGELGRLQDSISAAEPHMRRSALADKVASMIDKIIDEAFPSHIEDVAKAMTQAYRAMAHKDLVKRIAIEPDCSVRLLGNGGRDLREMDASAGESQIFALALIAAIATVSKRGFPIVMDTPLARLDPDHRRSVLKYFTDREGQVVLLSQPAEVGGEYLALIRPRVAKALHITYQEVADGVGRSRLSDGYGEEAA